MGFSDHRRHWIILYHQLDCIVSYQLDWIISYRLDRIVLAGLDRNVSAGSGNTGFYVLSGYWLDGTDGADELDGALVGLGWDGPTLAPAGTGALPLVPEQECHRWLLRGGGLWEVVAGTNCVGAARTRIICVGEANNSNRVHTNRNYHIVKDNINSTYDKIVLWMHKSVNL